MTTKWQLLVVRIMTSFQVSKNIGSKTNIYIYVFCEKSHRQSCQTLKEESPTVWMDFGCGRVRTRGLALMILVIFPFLTKMIGEVGALALTPTWYWKEVTSANPSMPPTLRYYRRDLSFNSE